MFSKRLAYFSWIPIWRLARKVSQNKRHEAIKDLKDQIKYYEDIKGILQKEETIKNLSTSKNRSELLKPHELDLISENVFKLDDDKYHRRGKHSTVSNSTVSKTFLDILIRNDFNFDSPEGLRIIIEACKRDDFNFMQRLMPTLCRQGKITGINEWQSYCDGPYKNPLLIACFTNANYKMVELLIENAEAIGIDLTTKYHLNEYKQIRKHRTILHLACCWNSRIPRNPRNSSKATRNLNSVSLVKILFEKAVTKGLDIGVNALTFLNQVK